MPDKRDYLRYAIEAKVSFKCEGDDSKVFKGKVLDFGYLGWGIFLKENIPVNTIIQFDLSVNFFDQHLIGKGKIVNVAQQKIAAEEGFRIGVAFMEADKDTIVEFINENQRLIHVNRRKIEAERRNQGEHGNIGPF